MLSHDHDPAFSTLKQTIRALSWKVFYNMPLSKLSLEKDSEKRERERRNMPHPKNFEGFSGYFEHHVNDLKTSEAEKARANDA